MERIELADGTVLERTRSSFGTPSYTTDGHFDREPPLWAWLAAESRARKEAGAQALRDAAGAWIDHQRYPVRRWLRERADKKEEE